MGRWQKISKIFQEIYAKGLSAGTNPNSKEYWGGFRNYDQKFVEIAAIAYGLLLAPDKLWEPLDDNVKKNLADFLLLSNSYEVSDKQLASVPRTCKPCSKEFITALRPTFNRFWFGKT